MEIERLGVMTLKCYRLRNPGPCLTIFILNRPRTADTT